MNIVPYGGALFNRIFGKELTVVERKFETEVIRMGDVGVCIDMVDSNLVDGDREKAERAVLVLKEIFSARYIGLRNCLEGGDGNA